MINLYSFSSKFSFCNTRSFSSSADKQREQDLNPVFNNGGFVFSVRTKPKFRVDFYYEVKTDNDGILSYHNLLSNYGVGEITSYGPNRSKEMFRVYPTDFHIFLPYFLERYINQVVKDDLKTLVIKEEYQNDIRAKKFFAFYLLLKHYYQFDIYGDKYLSAKAVRMSKNLNKNPEAIIKALGNKDPAPVITNLPHFLTTLFNKGTFRLRPHANGVEFEFRGRIYPETIESMVKFGNKHFDATKHCFTYSESTIPGKIRGGAAKGKPDSKGYPGLFTNDRTYERKKSNLYDKVDYVNRPYTKKLSNKLKLPFFPVKKTFKLGISNDDGMNKLISLLMRHLFNGKPFSISKKTARQIDGYKLLFFYMFYVGFTGLYSVGHFKRLIMNDYFCNVLYRLKSRPTREGCSPKNLKLVRQECLIGLLMTRAECDARKDELPNLRDYVVCYIFEKKKEDTGEIYVEPEHKEYFVEFQKAYPSVLEKLQTILKQQDKINLLMLDDLEDKKRSRRARRFRDLDHYGDDDSDDDDY